MKAKKTTRKAAKTAEAPRKGKEAASGPGATADSWVIWMILESGRQHAETVHIEQQVEGFTVRFRVDGAMRSIKAPEQSLQDGVISQLKKMARMKAEDDRLPHDGRFGAIVDSRLIDFCVHSMPTTVGESMVLRVFDHASLVPLDKLDLSAATLVKVRELAGKPRGLVLVVGPAGSGKTTTLYAVLSELAKEGKKVVTLEYPMEFELPGITQSRVDPRSGYDYVTALRQVERQDPDVVMVGRLDEAETVHAALQTALSGHLVLSTMHASDAAEAIARLLGMGVDPLLLSTGLTGIIEQRTVRRICPACKQSVGPNEAESGWLGLKRGQKLAKGRGCEECRNTGYKGRVGICAVLPVSEELRDLLLSRPQPNALRQLLRKAERTDLVPDGMDKVKAGLTTFEEVMKMAGYMLEGAGLD